MGKFDFIKQDNLLYWNDPDNGKSDGKRLGKYIL